MEQTAVAKSSTGVVYVLDDNLPAPRAREYGQIDRMINHLTYRLASKHDKTQDLELIKTSMDFSKLYMQRGFVEMVANAYSNHNKIEVAPHDLWYIVLAELATFINANSEKCRPLFTKAVDKQPIVVPTADPAQIDLAEVMAQLRERVPVDLDIFVPELTTATPAAVTAMYASVCDGLQSYYDYMTYLCGIRAIRVMGTVKDWGKLCDSADRIAAMFHDLGMMDVGHWLGRVESIFIDIWTSLQKPEDERTKQFWIDIYRQNNIGSGGQVIINGWIKDLFFEKRELGKLENYTTAISAVPFTNAESGREFIDVYGAFSAAVTPDGFIKTEYGSFTFEKVPVKPRSEKLPVLRTFVDKTVIGKTDK